MVCSCHCNFPCCFHFYDSSLSFLCLDTKFFATFFWWRLAAYTRILVSDFGEMGAVCPTLSLLELGTLLLLLVIYQTCKLILKHLSNFISLFLVLILSHVCNRICVNNIFIFYIYISVLKLAFVLIFLNQITQAWDSA